MATLTLYLQQASPPFTPTTKRGAWDDSSATAIWKMGSKSGDITYAQKSITSTDANYDMLVSRFVSDPLAAAMDFSGTMDGVIGAIGFDAALAAHLHLHVFILQGQTDSLRGTLYADYIDPDQASTGTTTSGEGFSVTMADVSALLGDTIVLECGFRCNASAQPYSVRIQNGGTDATDLTDGGNGNSYPGWIRFAYTTPAAGGNPGGGSRSGGLQNPFSRGFTGGLR